MKHGVIKSFFGLVLCLFFVAVLTVITPVKSSAAINPQINFQGKITNPDGTNIADANYTIVFSIYNVASAGTAQWTETDVVPVASGIFQVSLGAGTTLPGAVDFNTASIYLGIKVGADAEMTPRVRFTASPYAFNSDKVGGFTAAQLVQLSPGSAQAGTISVTGAIATTSTLTVQGANAATLGSTTNVGAILFQDGTVNNRTVTLNVPALPTASYVLTLPTIAPGVNQCLQSGAVTASQLIFASCPGAGTTLQTDYGNGSAGIQTIALNATNLGIKIQDAASTVGTIFTVTSNGGASYLTVTSTGVSVVALNANAGLIQTTGGLTVTGATAVNTSGTAATTIGNVTSAVSIASTALNVSSTGVISGVTGYTQASGNFGISGTGTFGTGTGLVALNGATTITNANAAANSLAINSGTTVPIIDQVAISNAGSTGVTTAGVNGFSVNYKGGAAAVEAAGFRVDYAPGGTSGGTWSGVRIVSNQATGAASGVNSYGIKLEGTSAAHTGNQTAVAIATGWDIGVDVQSGGIQLASLASDPVTSPAAGNLRVYTKLTAGRAMLRAKAPTGVSYNYQTSLTDQFIAFVTPGDGATATTFANISSVGAQWANSATAGFTIAAANQTLGSGMNMATAATAGTNVSTATQNQFFRGSAAGSNGFFSFARVATPDANYGTGATGTRMFFGLTDQTIGVMLGADAPAAGNFIGFQFSTNRADTAWQVIRRDGTTTAAVTATTAAVGAAGQQNHVYDLYLFTPGFGQTGAGTVFWRADDLVAGTTSEGSFATTLPTSSVAMKQGMGIQTLTTTPRNLQMNKMYIESDR